MKRRKRRPRLGLFILLVAAATIFIRANIKNDIILINNNNPLPDSYMPRLEKLSNGLEFDAEAIVYLEKMLDAARKDGCRPVVSSAYRSVDYQRQLFEKQVKKQQEQHGYDRKTAEQAAQTVVARAGRSEHNSGLAADIVSESDLHLEKDFAETKEGKWLAENCARFGFIVRYPEGKEQITGVIYEPWHFRYVGKAAAREIMSRGVCLEEYLGRR